jgi:N-acetyl-1-D-myo-inositol-2-amino-2-deoxy-alpha-D-glucopyranoside deacetylase
VRRKLAWVAGSALLVVLVGVTVLYRPFLADRLPLQHRPQSEEQLPLATSFTVGERTLIIAPHPDDETLGGGGVIEKAIRAGKHVKVVIVTTGDGYKDCVVKNYHVDQPGPADYRRLGIARHAESVQAMRKLGVRAEDVVFLGYPDGGVNGMWEFNWDVDNLHLGLNGATHAPYPFAFEQGVGYCGVNVVKNLTDIIRAFQPTDIVYPDPNDQHHDHWGTNAFVKYVLTQERYKVKEWTYLVHRGDFPTPWMYKPDLPLEPPYVLRHLDTHWLAVPMSEAERNQKRDATCQYRTQTNVMDPFLDAFVRTNELLGTYIDPPLSKQNGVLDVEHERDPSPFMLFHDAYADTIEREAEPSADLIAVGAVQAGKQFHLGVETRAPITAPIRYVLRMRLFRPSGVQRFDVTAEGSKLGALKLAHNSLDLPRGTTFHVKGNRLWLQLPNDVLTGSTALLVSADTFHGAKHVDKSAWRMIWIN